MRRPLLVTEHYIIKAEAWKKDSPVIGQIRHRQSPSGKVDFWQIKLETGEWSGKYPTQDEAEQEVRER
jgi:hypothetical protein